MAAAHLNPYEIGLDKNPANYVPLSPLSFIERTAMVYPTRTSVVHGTLAYTWSQTYERCRRLASALVAHGVKKGDTVACMLPNVPSMFEAHFGVPMTGAVLNTLNTRLDPEAIAFMLAHGEAKVLITDLEFSKVVKAALEQAGCTADMSNEEICDALVSAITSLKFTGLTGTDMSWNAEGQVSKAPTAYVVKDGQYVKG